MLLLYEIDCTEGDLNKEITSGIGAFRPGIFRLG